MISLVVIGAVLLGFALHMSLHLDPSVVAITGGLVLLAASRAGAEDVARDVEWPTLIFFAGLFVIVGALVATGVIDRVAGHVTGMAGDRLLLASMGLLWASAVLSAIVDNIPYVAALSPVVAELVNAGDPSTAQVLWWSLALGAGLGGNATAIGASANVVMLGIAERAGRPISFWEFTKYGLVVAFVAVVVSMAYLWLRYFALA